MKNADLSLLLLQSTPISPRVKHEEVEKKQSAKLKNLLMQKGEWIASLITIMMIMMMETTLVGDSKVVWKFVVQ